MRKLTDRTAQLLGPGVRRSSIQGWNAFLVDSGAIKQPLSYGEAVWSGAAGG